MLDDNSRVSVHLTMKINLGNYEMAESDVELTGLRPDTTSDDVDRLLEVGKLAYDRMKVKLAMQVNEIRRARQCGKEQRPAA